MFSLFIINNNACTQYSCKSNCSNPKSYVAFITSLRCFFSCIIYFSLYVCFICSCRFVLIIVICRFSRIYRCNRIYRINWIYRIYRIYWVDRINWIYRINRIFLRKSLNPMRARPCSGSGASRAIGSASATAFWAILLQTPSPLHPASRIIS